MTRKKLPFGPDIVSPASDGILIVEDNHALSGIFEVALRHRYQNRIQVMRAHSLEAAMTQLKQARAVSLAIIDVDLAGDDGKEGLRVVDAVHNFFNGARILIYTDYSDSLRYDEVLRLTAHGVTSESWFRKTDPPERIFDAIDRLLGSGAKLPPGPLPFRNVTEPTASAVNPMPSSDKIITLASVRALTALLLRDDSDLDAFCLDWFPEIFRRFGGAMDRIAKLTLLLSHVDINEFLAKLRQANPEGFAKHRHVLKTNTK